MTTFLRIRDPATNAVLLEVTDQADSDLLTQHMGSVGIAAGGNGSVAVPVTGSANQLYYWFIADSGAGNGLLPYFSDDGNTISWVSPSVSGTNRPGGTLFYGRF